MTTDQIENKRQKEKLLVGQMVDIYCKRNHHTKGALCQECERLEDYALKRVEKCPMMATKTFCSACKIHCYEKTMQEKIKKVMAYSGKWMLLYHPVVTIQHGMVTLKSMSNAKKQ